MEQGNRTISHSNAREMVDRKEINHLIRIKLIISIPNLNDMRTVLYKPTQDAEYLFYDNRHQIAK